MGHVSAYVSLTFTQAGRWQSGMTEVKGLTVRRRISEGRQGCAQENRRGCAQEKL
jgi:hypothetical protein